MIAYLIKSGLCLAILLVIYLVFLERHKMHQFNRFFLLAALVIGLAVPMFSIEIERQKLITETPIKTVNDFASISTEFVTKAAEYPSNRSKISDPDFFLGAPLNSEQMAYNRNFSFHLSKGLLLNIYTVICLLLLIRMGVGLFSFHRKRKENSVQELDSGQLILMEEPIAPHTFMNAIFVNKNQYQTGKVSEQIFEHELTHAKQKHSLDVLFVEFLRIIFWFNPVFYFYKRAIQINHEFLADDAVLDKTEDSSSYQNLLVESIFPSYGTNLSSSFNYALTKKRFKMMAKKSSVLSTLSRKAILIPVLGSIFLIFGTRISKERLSYEINGVKFIEPYNSAWVNSSPLIFAKAEEMNETLFSHRWKYYDEEGKLFTGEWKTEYTNGGIKVTTKSEIEAGKLVSRVGFQGTTGPYSILKSRFKGDIVTNSSYSENITISGVIILNYKSDEISRISILSGNEDGSWSEILGVETSEEKVYLNTTFNNSWEIKDQKLFGEKGDLPVTERYKKLAGEYAEQKYEETLHEYERVLSKNRSEDAELVYAELKLVHSIWLAYEKELNRSSIPELPLSPTERGKL